MTDKRKVYNLHCHPDYLQPKTPSSLISIQTKVKLKVFMRNKTVQFSVFFFYCKNLHILFTTNIYCKHSWQVSSLSNVLCPLAIDYHPVNLYYKNSTTYVIQVVLYQYEMLNKYEMLYQYEMLLMLQYESHDSTKEKEKKKVLCVLPTLLDLHEQ